jgi:hypothetical protein
LIKADSAKSQIRASISRALATALVNGIGNCSEENRPLSELQMIDLATMVIMAYDQAIQGCENIDLDERLRTQRDESNAFRYKHDLKRLATLSNGYHMVGHTGEKIQDILRKYRD